MRILLTISIVLTLLMLGACQSPSYDGEALKTVQVGTSYDQLVKKVGKPTKIKRLDRWVYVNENQVLMGDGVVFDFKEGINLQSRGGCFYSGEAERLAKGWKKLKIGLNADEVKKLLGKPRSTNEVRLCFYREHQQLLLENGVVVSKDLKAYATMEKFDRMRLNFTTTGIHIINIALALIMFGIALELRVDNFRDVIKRPRSFLVGLFSQFIMLPLVSFVLILIIKPTTSVAMGMILVAACPGGNISNFMSSLSKANTALSISLTSFATIVTVFMTPLNFSFWGNLYVGASADVVPISIDIKQMVKTVMLILGLPVILGIGFSVFFPRTSEYLKKPIKIFGVLFFLGLIVGALAANFNFFIGYIHLIFLLVLGHNLLALLTGFGLARLFRLPRPDMRTLTIETGIQNSGLGLVLIFNPKLFDGLGGMAFIAAWWGIWHIVSGLLLSAYWYRR